MSVEEFSSPLVNWPLFVFTSLIIILRTYVPLICLWILNHFNSSSLIIDGITGQLKRLTDELKTISQQDEFAVYVRKERQCHALLQRLTNERNDIEIKQKKFLNYIRLILNIGTILMMILLTITGQRSQSISLFYFSFFHFPLIIWIMSLNTFLSTLNDIYLRYRTNKKSTD